MGEYPKQPETKPVKQIFQFEAIISSMTPKERRYPDLISGSRKTGGSGFRTQIQDVNRLLKQLKQMQKMMKKMGRKGAINNMMRGLGGMMQQGVPSFLVALWSTPLLAGIDQRREMCLLALITPVQLLALRLNMRSTTIAARKSLRSSRGK